MVQLRGGLFILFAFVFLSLATRSAPLEATPTIRGPLQSDISESLTQRRAVVYGTGCATVPVVVPVLFFPVVSPCMIFLSITKC